jgi:hypothetical protein
VWVDDRAHRDSEENRTEKVCNDIYYPFENKSRVSIFRITFDRIKIKICRLEDWMKLHQIVSLGYFWQVFVEFTARFPEKQDNASSKHFRILISRSATESLTKDLPMMQVERCYLELITNSNKESQINWRKIYSLSWWWQRKWWNRVIFEFIYIISTCMWTIDII